MSTAEMNTAADREGDQRLKEEDSPPVLNEFIAPLNFSELTPSQFGISVQSFNPPLSNRKDKSRLAQMKARRRSSVGVRGSPETNSLIRYMAQQKMKTPPSLKTPEPVKSSPFLPRVASTLRQKMASFQNLMDVEESEVCDQMPRQDSNTGGHIKTGGYLSDGNNHDGGKENLPPTPTPNKRRRVSPLEGCGVEIREAITPVPQLNFKEQEENVEPVTQAVTKGTLPSSEAVEESQAVLVSPPAHVDFKPPMFSELQAGSPTNNQQDGVFELQSPSAPPPDGPAVASAAQPSAPSHIPSLLEMEPKEEDNSAGTPTIKKKKKQVRFGGPLSPEFFDKTLPPNTPLLKGATPARAPTPGGALVLRSALKTPQRSESQTPQAQPDLGSPTVFGASPVLALPRSHRTQPEGEDSEEQNRQIVFPSMEEIDSAGAADTGRMWDVKPLNLDTAFHEESLSHILTESLIKPSDPSETDTLDDPVSLPEEEQPEAAIEATDSTSSSNQNKKSRSERESATEAPTRSSNRKRKQPEESEPMKRSTRTAAKSASGKMKLTSKATRQWNKEVNRSLYGSREYASKNPTLSPITERLSFLIQSPAVQQTPTTSCTAQAQEPELTLEMGESANNEPVTEVAKDTQDLSDITATDTLETPSEASGTSPNSSKESTTGRGRRPTVRGLKRRKVSVSDDDLHCKEPLDQTGEKADNHCEDKTTTSQEVSTETSLKQTEPQQEEVDTEGVDAQTSADVPYTDCDGNSEASASLDAPSSACPPLCEETNGLNVPAESTQRKAKSAPGKPRGRRSSFYSSVLPEQESHGEENPKSHEVEVKGDEASNQQENNGSSSDSQAQEEEEAKLDLAPWQADFNIEDVFKPVATRGQRSVRRSLRNMSNAENSTGLAWLPRASPESIRETRRRTRSRRFCSILPILPSDPEDTQHKA